MTVDSVLKERTLTLNLGGVLDISSATIFTHAMEEVKDFDEIDHINIDMESLDFLDSTGIGVFLDLIYLTAEENFTVQFQNMDEDVEEILETVGVFDIMNAMNKEVL